MSVLTIINITLAIVLAVGVVTANFKSNWFGVVGWFLAFCIQLVQTFYPGK